MLVTFITVAVVITILMLVVWLRHNRDESKYNSTIGMLRHMLTIPESAVLANSSVDHLMLVRTVYRLAAVLAATTLFGLVVLLPIHLYLGSAHISSLPDGSYLFYVHLLVPYLTVSAILYVLLCEQDSYIAAMRHCLLSPLSSGIHPTAVLVRFIPHYLRNPTAFEEHLNNLFPDQVESASLVGASGFVVFRNFPAKVLSLSAPLSRSPFVMKAESCPNRNEIIWDNLKLSWRKTLSSRILMYAGLVLSFCIFGAAICMIGMIAQGVWTIFDSDSINDIFSLVVAPLMFCVVLMIQYPVIKRVCHFGGYSSLSNLEETAFRAHLLFAMVEFFGITMFLVVVLEVWEDILENPLQIFSLVASALSDYTEYFLVLCVYLSLLIPCIRLFFLRDEVEDTQKDEGSLEWTFTHILLVMGLLYSSFCPLVVIAVFPGLALIGFTSSLRRLVSTSPNYTKMGIMFPRAFSSLVNAILAYEMVLTLYFLLREAYGVAILMIPLMFVTMRFGRTFVSSSSVWKIVDVNSSVKLIRQSPQSLFTD